MTGPFLRLLYLDQPDGEFLEIAMEPIFDWSGNPRVFDLIHHKDCSPQLGTEAVEYLNSPESKGPRTIDPEKKLVFRI
ncbi:MAG: hypothetical protein KBB55_01215 [Candidatus Buchananbacteria bacterium]|nr:hypothetical protein [Candidatus Buchananbacteria bacterium]